MRYKNLLPIFMALGSMLAAPCALAADTELAPLDCMIEPDMVIAVSSPVPGLIESIAVDKSDVVKKGQPLIQLEAAVEKAAVAEAKARASMVGDVNAKRARLAYARRNLERSKGLVADGALSPHEADEIETEAQLAYMELQQALDAKALAELELQRAQETLNLRTITSPVDAVVVDRMKSPGESVEQDPILKLAQLNPLRVEVIVPAAMFGTITTDMPAEVMPEAPAGSSYAAKVAIVDRMVDAASGTFSVRLALPNPDYRLPGGLRCTVKFGAAPAVADSAPTPPIPVATPATDPAAAGVAPALTTPTAAELFKPAAPLEMPRPQTAPPAEQATPATADKSSASSLTTTDVAASSADTQAETTTTTATTSPTCVSVGPFAKRSQADTWTDRLQNVAQSIDLRTDNDRETIGYRVLTPRFPDTAQLESFTAQLENAGIRDFHVMPNQRVALGYYRQKSTVEKRGKQLSNLNIPFAIEPHYRDQTHYWLDLAIPGTAAGADELGGILKTGPAGAGISRQPCQDPPV